MSTETLERMALENSAELIAYGIQVFTAFLPILLLSAIGAWVFFWYEERSR